VQVAVQRARGLLGGGHSVVSSVGACRLGAGASLSASYGSVPSGRPSGYMTDLAMALASRPAVA
jgi:hypothetical protein